MNDVTEGDTSCSPLSSSPAASSSSPGSASAKPSTITTVESVGAAASADLIARQASLIIVLMRELKASRAHHRAAPEDKHRLEHLWVSASVDSALAMAEFRQTSDQQTNATLHYITGGQFL